MKKAVSESRFTMSALMNPHDANPLGNVHGGVIMKLADETGAIVAMRHAGSPVVTVAVDTMTFLKPIYVGNLVLCHGELTYAGTTSMEVRIEIVAENLLDGTHELTNIAYFVYVALDQSGKPHHIPELILETNEQRRRFEQAAQRQDYRKQQKAIEEENLSHE